MQQVVEGRPADAEQLGGLDDVAVGARERRDDCAALGLFAHGAQIELTPRSSPGSAAAARQAEVFAG